jgi:hypothetical protein
LPIVRELGQRLGLHVWRHSLRHTRIYTMHEIRDETAFQSMAISTSPTASWLVRNPDR